MKKNFLFGLFATAMLLLTTACQKENDLVNGNEVMVNFEVSAPVIATRAYSDGETATNLQYAVYNSNKEQLATMKFGEQTGVGTAEMDNLKAKVSMRLALGNTYYVLFWADAYAEGEPAPYTVNFLDKKLTVDYTGALSNDENRDAFYCWKEVTDEELRRGSVKIEMRRPFAQLNIGTGDTEIAAASGVTVRETAVKVKAYQTMDFVEGTVSDPVEAGVQFGLAAKPVNQTFPVANYDYLAMNYLLVGTDKEVVNEVVFEYTGAEATTPEKRVFTSIPLRRNYRTNIYGNLLTQAVDFNVEIKPAYENENAEDNLEDDVFVVSTDNELKAALAKDDEVIRITLADDVSLNVSDAYIKLGTENTKSIIIDGAGIVRSGNHTLTLATTYWSRLNTVNPEACIVLKNLNLTSTQATGTWNSYDVTFQCNVELENVTLNKALALDNAGKKSVLKNVTINETHDYYAMWISAAGQHVSIDGLTIASAGRGIKIDEQYVDAPSKVTLDIKNAAFTTAKKAAIMVKSAAGAEIGLNNINLKGVAADQVNAVWVDEDAAAYADKVIVKGGTKVVESDIVSNQDDLNSALKANERICLSNGEYTLNSCPAGVTFVGCGNNVVLHVENKKFGVNGDVAAENVKLVFSNANYCGFQHTGVEYYKNCTIVGQPFLYGNNVTFEGCTFEQTSSDAYNVWTYGANNVTFKNCKFNSAGKSVLIYHENKGQNVTFEGCELNASTPVEGKAAIEIDSSLLKGDNIYNIVINGTTANGFANGNVSGNSLWNQKKGSKSNITVDNRRVLEVGYEMISSNEGLDEALKSDAEKVYLSAGEYTMPAGNSFKKNTTLVCAEGTVFTGNSKLNINGATIIGATFSNTSGNAVSGTINGTFKGCKFEGANAIRGSYAGETVVFEDCVFSGSTYGVHFDGGANDVIFRNCTLSGFNAFGAALTMVTFEGCTFVGNGKSGYNGANLWGSAKMIDCEFTFNGSTANEWIDCIGADKTYEFTNCTVNEVDYTKDNYKEFDEIFSREENKITVKINGEDCEM